MATKKPARKADQTNWRRLVRQDGRLKLTDAMKQRFLDLYAKTGRKGDSIRACGISKTTLQTHVKDDPEFASAIDAAYMTYCDMLEDLVFERGFKGMVKGRVLEPLLNDDGTRKLDVNGKQLFHVVEERTYSDSLAAMHARRHIEAYKDKSELDLTLTGVGVMVAPAEMTPEDWVAEQMAKNKDRKPPEGVEDV